MSGWGVALGLALGTAMAAPGDLRWEFATGAFIRSTPAIGDDGTVYFGSGGGGLYAVDGATGQERWRLATGPIVGSPVTGPNGLVYVAEWESEQWNQSPGVYGVDARTGARKWGFNPQYAGGFRASPAVGQNGLLHVVSERGWWYVLNAETGQGRRVFIPEDWGQYSSPVVGADGILYLGMPERGLFALDPSTGVRLWVHRPEIVWNGGPGPVGGFHASPAVGRDGTLYLGSTDGSLYAFDPFTGAVQWRAPTGGPITSSAAVGPDGIVYFGSNDKRVRAVEGATGLLRWEFAAGAGVHSTPTLTADGTLYFGSYDRNVYAVEAATGRLHWEFATTGLVLGSAAVGLDGTVFIGSFDGKLYALEGIAPLAKGPWPSFRGDFGNRATGERPGPPVVLRPPDSHFVAADTPVALRAIISGELPMEFEWWRDGERIADVQEARLHLASPQREDAGTYRLRARNAKGEVETGLTLTIGYRLTVGQGGGGTVQSSSGEDLHLPDSTLALTAVSDVGRAFLGWLGDAEGKENPLIVKLDRHRHVAARFHLEPGESVWEFVSGGEITGGPPAIGPDGTLYLVRRGVRFPILSALHPATGAPRWEIRGEDDEHFGPPAVDQEGTVFVVVNGSVLLAIHGASGNEQWRYQKHDSWVHSRVAVGPGGLVCVRVLRAIQGLDAATGAVRWAFAVSGEDGGVTPVVSAKGTVFVVGGESARNQLRPVVALDSETGELKWSRALNERVWSTPAIGADGTLYLQAFSDLGGWRLYALDGESGALRWKSEHTVYHTLIGVGGVIYGLVAAGSAETWALHPDTGEALWRSPFSGQLILGADQTLYVLAYDGQVVALDAGSGQERWRRELNVANSGSAHAPALGPDSTLYFVSGWSPSRLHAIRATSGLASTAWPAEYGQQGNRLLSLESTRLRTPRLEVGRFQVAVPTVPGQTYLLESRSNASAGPWAPAGAVVPGDGSWQQLVHEGAPADQRFYRVRLEPVRSSIVLP